MSTAVCRTRIWQGTVYSKPAEVTGAGAIEARTMIRTIHRTEQIRGDPLVVAVEADPLGIAHARLIHASSVS
jgi:hypothetical protein